VKPAGLVERAAIVAGMVFGSVMLWFGWPLGLIYVVSKLVTTSRPQLGPYAIIIVGVPLGMTVIGRGLGWLDRHYRQRTATEGDRYRPGWLKSMRDDRHAASHWHVLDVVMLWSVATAALAMGVWFVFFPSSPLS
jgi:uncharacterized membrane protein